MRAASISSQVGLPRSRPASRGVPNGSFAAHCAAAPPPRRGRAQGLRRPAAIRGIIAPAREDPARVLGRLVRTIVGAWRSLVAHLHGVQGVPSSNLGAPTIIRRLRAGARNDSKYRCTVGACDPTSGVPPICSSAASHPPGAGVDECRKEYGSPKLTWHFGHESQSSQGFFVPHFIRPTCSDCRSLRSDPQCGHLTRPMGVNPRAIKIGTSRTPINASA
jgi:hypothetical protein